MTIADALDYVLQREVAVIAQLDRHPPGGQLRNVGLSVYSELAQVATLDDPAPALRTFIDNLRDDITGIEALTPPQADFAMRAGILEQTPVHILIASFKQELINILVPILERGAQ